MEAATELAKKKQTCQWRHAMNGVIQFLNTQERALALEKSSRNSVLVQIKSRQGCQIIDLKRCTMSKGKKVFNC